jgi:hypothetical protein
LTREKKKVKKKWRQGTDVVKRGSSLPYCPMPPLKVKKEDKEKRRKRGLNGGDGGGRTKEQPPHPLILILDSTMMMEKIANLELQTWHFVALPLLISIL